jgi:hypothetical protein
MTASKPHLQFLTWREVFVLIDDGKARRSDYDELGERVLSEVVRFPKGVGALIIIPPDATPPREDTRRAMNDLMRKLGQSLRCLCWMVEGSGFQGAMVRAVLTGLKAFGRFGYPCNISSDLNEALGWIREQLSPRKPRPGEIEEGARWITDLRQHEFGGSEAATGVRRTRGGEP